MYSTKIITFSQYSIDILVLDSLPAYKKKLELLRPLRVSSDGQLLCLYKNKAYPLVLDKNGETCILLDGAVFDPRKTSAPSKLPITFDLRYIEPPLEFKISDEVQWRIERNQFGVYIFLSASDEVIEKLVSIMIEKNNLNILSWGENINTTLAEGFNWYIKLSSGLSIENVRSTIVSVFNSKSVSEQNASTSDKVNSENENLLRSKFEKEAATFNNSIKKLQKENEGLIERKDSEIALLYEEISRLTTLVDTLQSDNASRMTMDPDNTAALVVKRRTVDRVLADALYSCFPALAFSPDVVSELKTRFVGSSSIWETFRKLNSGEDLSLEKLSGLPGKAGWMELKKHINTGKDNRGRLYCRKSKRTHNFDVVIHWKKNEKDQQKVFKRLTNYTPFETTKTVFM